ncbi:unnamed protein product [Miscanthus lutarioriparius]|uniref:Uncharacterized protein n=1 Tax=Miscanthus lutarioriparius TaxID=422564 RepID=A0A811N6Y4_9POAL|nr:unnamed protein product [Miscanthus lutarioriparius]
MLENWGMWGYLTGERICPPRPLLPTPPTYPPDADDDAKNALLEAFETEMESYQSDLGVYETWLREEKSAKAILLASMEVDLSLSLRGLATSHLMWDHLRRSYEIRNEAMYLAVVEEAQSLRQLDSTVEAFHRQMTAVWHRLDSLGAEFCGGGTCRCCDRHRDQRDILRLHEFLSRLRPEFETVRAQLLTRRPRPSLSEAMPELRAEETRLRAGGVTCAPPQPSVLAATPPQVSPSHSDTMLEDDRSALLQGPRGQFCSHIFLKKWSILLKAEDHRPGLLDGAGILTKLQTSELGMQAKEFCHPWTKGNVKGNGMEGRRWRANTYIGIWEDPWIPAGITRRPRMPRGSVLLSKVSELIDPLTSNWDSQLVRDIFWEEDVANILSIPIQPASEDAVAWHFDSKGIFSVKSAYHVLEDNQELKKDRSPDESLVEVALTIEDVRLKLLEARSAIDCEIGAGLGSGNMSRRSRPNVEDMGCKE